MTDMISHPLALKAQSAFHRRFGCSPSVVVHAPGRINLIGEHTDYNHGYVLPAAIEQGICMAMRMHSGKLHEWVALDTNEEKQLIAETSASSGAGWADYFNGAFQILLTENPNLPAFQCVFTSDLPAGAGLSSSSALTCGFLLGLNTLLKLHKTREELAWMAHLVEHNFIGLQGGIMDQHACLLCKQEHLLLLDCLKRSYEHIPFDNGKHVSLFLIDTRVQHKLTDSDYNTRAAECRRALALLQSNAGIQTLRDLTSKIVEDHSLLLGPTLMQRLNFVLEENARVLAAIEHIRGQEWSKLGELLYQSHRGLRDQYVVSCRELDFLTETVRDVPGILGARMMGGGFGGCTINLTTGSAGIEYREQVTARFRERFGWDCAFIDIRLAQGAAVSSLE
jgi:galactokinase